MPLVLRSSPAIPSACNSQLANWTWAGEEAGRGSRDFRRLFAPRKRSLRRSRGDQSMPTTLPDAKLAAQRAPQPSLFGCNHTETKGWNWERGEDSCSFIPPSTRTRMQRDAGIERMGMEPVVPWLPPLGTLVDARRGVKVLSVLSYALSNGTFQSGWSYRSPCVVHPRTELFHLARPLVVRLGNSRCRCRWTLRGWMILQGRKGNGRMKSPPIAAILRLRNMSP